MNRLKISLHTPKEITDFVNICSKYECDINIYDGSVMLDAKSIIAIFGINLGKVIEVQAISSDKSVISSFIKDMKKFEV